MSDFVVRPFAFMRLTHDALRSGFAAVHAAANAGDLEIAAAQWHALCAVIALHMKQEETSFFPLLDRLFDQAVAKANLRDTHERELAHEERVEAAIEAQDRAALVAALDAWAPDFEAHLAHEEEVMMPLTDRVATTPEGRAAAVNEILNVDWEALRTSQLPYVAHALASTKPYGTVRMFVSAVQAAAGGKYEELQPVLRDALPAEMVAMLVEHGHLDAPTA